MNKGQLNIDEQVKEQTKILAHKEYLEPTEFMTKKGIYPEIKKMTRLLVLLDYYSDTKLDNLCSLIQQTLEKYNISYPRTKLSELFDDDEKHFYNHGRTNVTTSDNKNSPLLKQNNREPWDNWILRKTNW